MKIAAIIIALSLTANFSSQDTPIGKEIIKNQKTRIKDAFGKGQFLASRDKGTRTHQGLDIVADPGEAVYAPIDGTIIREAVPYKDDKSYRGIVLRGINKWEGYEMKIFYVEGLFSGNATAGQQMGTAQDLTKKYPGITNHIHVEVKFLGKQVDPCEIWQMSF